MATETLKVIHVFSAGVHTSMRGATYSYPPQLLEHTALMYDPKQYPAPVCIGHPDDNQPVFGWVKSLLAKGSELFAEVSLSSALINLGKQRGVTSVSCAFSIQGFRDAITPALLRLRHIGFLPPEMQPGVKGLRPVEFGAPIPIDAVVFAQAGEALRQLPANVVGFAAHPADTMRAGRLQLHARALEYRRACPSLSYIEAVRVAESVPV